MTERIECSKTNRSHMITYLLSPFLFMFGWGCHVWDTHVYDPSPQEFILDMLVHWTITPQFSHIRLFHHNQPIEKIHPFISYPKNSQTTDLYFCVVCVQETDKEWKPDTCEVLFCQVSLPKSVKYFPKWKCLIKLIKSHNESQRFLAELCRKQP